MLRYLIPLGVFIVMVALLAVGLTRDPRLIPSPLIDKPVPEFNLPLVEDPDKSLSRADLLGQVSLINVWATWCVSCRQEHAFLMALARSERVPIYSLDYKDNRADALNWLTRFGNPYRATAFDADGRVGIDWGVYGTPETFLVDQHGTIRYKHVGPLSEEVWKERILPLIEALEGAQA
jgi:cytochrome c biogenesis protein CcmG/thiol:disulfide interchange protein DsbE